MRIMRCFIPMCEKWQEWKCDTSIGIGRKYSRSSRSSRLSAIDALDRACLRATVDEIEAAGGRLIELWEMFK